jgi:predicted esterase
MARFPFSTLVLAALVAVTMCVPAVAAGPALKTPPPVTAPSNPEKRSGVLSLSGGAFAYLPKGMDGTKRPLIVYFIGARGEPNDVLNAYRNHADREGFILLIPVPKAASWDLIEDLQRRFGIEMNVTPRYGKDIRALDQSLADLFSRVAVDQDKIAVMGFSNGATYALSVGTANPQLFRTVIALSPGPAFPTVFDQGQRVFVSHGESDEVLPYSYTRSIVARMRVKKMQVEFVPFKGRHEIPADVRIRALEYFLDRKLRV